MNAFRLWRRALLLAVFSLAAIVSPTLAQDSPPTVRVNVIACVDPDCADTVNLVTMEGATVASFDASGAQLDACTVTETPSGMAACALILAPEGGWYTTEPTAAYAGYRLVSSEPEVFESEMHGTILVWYYAPGAAPAEPAPIQAPPATGVTVLPSTGVGAATNSGLLAAVALTIGVGAAVGTRLRMRTLS